MLPEKYTNPALDPEPFFPYGSVLPELKKCPQLMPFLLTLSLLYC